MNRRPARQRHYAPLPAPLGAAEGDPRRKAAVSWLLERARSSRQNPSEFFGFVMREEFTRERILSAAHQELLFEFVMAHPRCVIRMPVGFSKTYCLATLGMWNLGREPTARGAIISASEGQAAKPVALVRDYIEGQGGFAPELRLVYPSLRRSPREADPWTQTKLVVDRSPGIRDPSLRAVGFGGRLPGSRLSWILVDDVVDEENSQTEHGRKAVQRWFGSVVLSRRDVRGARIVVTNTPWHPQDLTYFLEGQGWPTLTMEIEGEVTITNTDWDSPLIRPSYLSKDLNAHRLTAHDHEKYGAPLCVQDGDGNWRVARRHELADAVHFDVGESVPLWPEKYPVEVVARLREENEPLDWQQLYKMKCRDESTSRCKSEWVEQCKDNAKALGIATFVQRYEGPNLVVTGIDLGIGENEDNALTAFFTFEVIPKLELVVAKRVPVGYQMVGQQDAPLEPRVRKRMRRILDVEAGRWSGPEIISKIIDKTRRFGSVAAVETNAGQKWIQQWALERDASVPVKSHHTGRNKHAIVHGVESVFVELSNGAWIIPCDREGRCHPDMQRAIDDCLFYQPPPVHTGDVLMAWWIAREQARKMMAGLDEDAEGSVGATIMQR